MQHGLSFRSFTSGIAAFSAALKSFSEVFMFFKSVRRLSFVCALSVGLFAFAANAKAVKDTPVPADHQCNYVNFHHNEAKNALGPGKCATDCDCDGMRSCESGMCSGKARPAKLTAATCNSKDYHYQEAWTKAGAGKCSGDCECDGERTCVSGECKGTAR